MRTAVGLVLVFASLSAAFAQVPITNLGSFAGRGFDIVYERMKPRLISQTYSTQYTMKWQGNDWLVPDELYETLTPRTVFDSRARVYQNYEEHFSQTVRSTTLSAGLTYAGFTLSGAFSNTKGQINELLKNGSRAFSTVNNVVDFFQLAMYPIQDETQYDKRFAQAVAVLPTNYDPVAYGRFIHGWGTHFINSAQYGGKVNFTVSFDESLVKSNSVTWAERQVGLSIGYAMFSLNFNSSLATNKTDFDQQFKQSSNSTKEIYGGQGYVLETEGFGPWVNTVYSAPALILEQSEILPITELIFDENKRKNIGTALLDYCNNAANRDRVAYWARHGPQIPLYDDEY